MKIDIAICCHKNYELLTSDCLIPTQAGKACAKNKLKMRGDDTGDNISNFNKYYGEGTVLYWLWKNSDADILGLMQYRRYFNLINDENIFIKRINLKNKSERLGIIRKYGLYEENVKNLIKKNDIITLHKENTRNFFYGNVEQQYKGSHTSWVWDEALRIVKEKNNDFYNFVEDAKKKNDMYFKNMFITKKEIFDEICLNTLGITESLKNRIDLSWPEYNNGCRSISRVLGFILERLIGLYILFLQSKGRKILECGSIDILEEDQKSTEDDEKTSNGLLLISNDEILPKSSKNVIVMGCNDSYSGPCSVTIESILENSDISGFEFVFLFNLISYENLELIKKTIDGKVNARYYDISTYFNQYKKHFHQLDQVSTDTYLRLFIPLLFKKYDKALWLDCDLIVKQKINNLFRIDLDDAWLAAVQDPYIATVSYSSRDSKEANFVRNHLEKDLNISDYSAYFNAGVILFNIRQCTLDDVPNRIEKIILSVQKLRYQDQDVLNYLCGGKHIKWISMYWNVAGNNQIDWSRFKDFPKYKQNLFAQQNAYIYHYCGWCKPWDHPEMPNAFFFWQYARKSPYYERLLLASTLKKDNLDIDKSGNLKNDCSWFLKKILKSKIKKYKFLNIITFHLVHDFKSREKKYKDLLSKI